MAKAIIRPWAGALDWILNVESTIVVLEERDTLRLGHLGEAIQDPMLER